MVHKLYALILGYCKGLIKKRLTERSLPVLLFRLFHLTCGSTDTHDDTLFWPIRLKIDAIIGILPVLVPGMG